MKSSAWIAHELDKIRRELRAAVTTPQLGQSSLEDASIKEYDREGRLVSQHGKQFDGTHGSRTLGGPVPPVPTVPILSPEAGQIRVRWDGEWVQDPDRPGGLPVLTPLDWVRTEVHRSDVDGFNPTVLGITSVTTLVGAISSALGGEVTFRAEAGVPFYVKLVARTEPGKFSTPSEQATETSVDFLPEQEGRFATANDPLALKIANNLDDLEDVVVAQTNLALVPGVNVQPASIKLTSLAAQSWAANQFTYQTGLSTSDTTGLSPFARTLLDDVDSAAARTTLGLRINIDVQAYGQFLEGISDLNPLTTPGFLFADSEGAQLVHWSAMDSMLGLVIGTDVQAWDLALEGISGVAYPVGTSILARLADGEWDALMPSEVRTLLGLVIGTNVQAYDADLSAIAALAPANDDFIQRKGGVWVNRTIAQVQADLGVGGGGGATNLSASYTTTTATVISDTGTDAVLTAATASEAGVMTSAQVNDLAGKAPIASPTFTGTLTTPLLHNTSTTTALLDTNVYGNTVGGLTGVNTVYARSRIQARNNGAASTLDLNPLGGSLDLGLDGTFLTTIRTALKLTNAGTAGAGKVLTSDADGDATWQTPAGGGATNLTTAYTLTTATVLSDTGTDAVITAANATEAGVMTVTMLTKLNGIATGATANDTDANLKDRANHTGTQSADTIVDGSTNRAFTALEDAKLSGIATGATVYTDGMADARVAVAVGTPTAFARTVLDDVDAAAARVTLGTPTTATWPQIISTYYHEILEGNNATALLVLDRLHALPFYVPTNCSFDDVAFDVTTFGAAGALMRCGLYGSGSDGLPGALIQDAGTVATTTNGVKQRSFSAVTLTAGVRYYIAMAPQGVTCTVRHRATNNRAVPNLTAASMGTNQPFFYRAGVSGALPDPFGTVVGIITGPASALKLT